MSFQGFNADQELQLTADEAEILSSINFSASAAAAKSVEEENEQAYQQRLAVEAKAYQAKVADELGTYYETGNAQFGVARDLRKATKFKRDKSDVAKKQRESAVSVLGQEVKTTEYFDNISWFSSARLFTWRLHRVISLTYKPSPELIKFNSYGGLSYILELIVDFYNIGKATIAPTPEQERAMPRWKDRFWYTAKKDERPMRMLNAAMWFSVNLACFFMTGGTSAIVNTTFFVADLCVDSYKAIRDYLKYRALLKKIDAKIESLTRELAALPDHRNETKAQIEARIEKQITLDNYKFRRTAVAKKQKEVVSLRAYFVVATALILVGMILFFFPPAGALFTIGALAVGAKLIGACLAFSGSIMTFGRRVKKKSEAVLAERAANQPKVDQPENSKDIELEDLTQTHRAQRLLSVNAAMHQSLTAVPAVQLDEVKRSVRPDEIKDTAWSDAGVSVVRVVSEPGVGSEEKPHPVSAPIACPSKLGKTKPGQVRQGLFAGSLEVPKHAGQDKDVLYPMRSEFVRPGKTA